MHRFRSWALSLPEWRTQRNRLLPVEGGDGSTLSLDFTTGVLDPRLAFTRSTNATFINSSGLVQYADANYVQNSNDVTASGWSVQNGVARSFDNAVNNPEGGLGASLVTASSSIGSSAVNTSSFTVNGGLTYTVSFWIRAGTATQALVGVYDPAINPPTGAFTPASALVISGPGSAIGSSSIVVSGLTSSWTRVRIHLSPANSGSRAVSIYPDAALASGKSIYIWGVKWQAGHVANPTQITTGATAYYAPRFDYDPTSIGTPRGLLIEGSANNLQPYSEDLSQTGTWTQQALAGITANVSGITDPAGGTSASKIRSNSAIGTSHLVYSTRSTVSGTAYTMSAWVRAAEYNFAALHFASGANRYTVVFNLTTGEVTQTNTYGSPTGTGQNAVKFGNWWRLSVTMNAADTTSYPHICLSPTGTPSVNSFGQPAFTGTAESGVYVWGAQLETGSGASSYIPTGASTGFRAADSCVMTGTNFSSWYASATAGTFYSEFDNPRSSLGAAQTPAFIGLGDYSAGNLISAYFGGYTVGQSLVAAIWGSGGTGFQTATVPTSVSVATGNKAAFAFSGQSVMGGFRGNASASATTTGTVNAKTVLYIGGNGASGTTNRDFLNSCVQRIKFFPTQFTAAQLQALTT